MGYGTLILRNLRRHPLRVVLTTIGVAVVILAFNLIVTTVRAWYASADEAVPNRLISRHAASLSIHLPLAYRDRIAALPGVTGVSYANWFGGVYRDAKGFFPQFAVDPGTYLDLHPEVVVTEDERRGFIEDRRGCLIGRKLAALYGWKVGDVVPLTGTLYPGEWEFVVRGIYHGHNDAADEGSMLIRWDAMNERRRQVDPDRAGTVGWYVIRIANPEQAAHVARAVDDLFGNSASETRTETEQAFQMSFVALSGSLIAALKVLALALNGVTLLVLANTLVLSVRERTRELAVLVAMGFRPRHLAQLIVGETLCLGGTGILLGTMLTIPAVRAFAFVVQSRLGNFFQHFSLTPTTLLLGAVVTLGTALVAALVPATLVLRVQVVTALRHTG